MAKDRIPVNLADPKDIEAKMPQIRELLAKRREELDALQAQVKLLDRIVGKETAGATAAAQRSRAPRKSVAPAQERAIQALDMAGRPMGPTSLFDFMKREGLPDLPRDANSLGARLWSAAKAGRIVKAPNGTYAPLGTPTDRPLTDYDEAARKGMPAPAGSDGNAVAANQASPNGSPPEGGDRELRFEDSRGRPG